ncbi:hypothetical protein PMAYCL1PPCAC_16431, partial [Pristionchus mayeri]
LLQIMYDGDDEIYPIVQAFDSAGNAVDSRVTRNEAASNLVTSAESVIVVDADAPEEPTDTAEETLRGGEEGQELIVLDRYEEAPKEAAVNPVNSKSAESVITIDDDAHEPRADIAAEEQKNEDGRKKKRMSRKRRVEEEKEKDGEKEANKPPMKCVLCKKWVGDAIKHAMSVHCPDQPLFACNRCDSYYFDKKDVLAHITKTHDTGRPIRRANMLRMALWRYWSLKCFDREPETDNLPDDHVSCEKCAARVPLACSILFDHIVQAHYDEEIDYSDPVGMALEYFRSEALEELKIGGDDKRQILKM